LNDAVEQLDMSARGDLGNDAAERSVLINLTSDDIRQNTPPPRRVTRNDGRCGFVATCLDAKDNCLDWGLN
jgi:hypothetical protein